MRTKKEKQQYQKAWYLKHPDYQKKYYRYGRPVQKPKNSECNPPVIAPSKPQNRFQHYNKRCDCCGHYHFVAMGVLKRCMSCHKCFCASEFEALKDVSEVIR